jgi:hypothetical protein
MSTPINDGGPAFPVPGYQTSDGGVILHHEGSPGMALRDYFAARALQGLLANPDFEGTQEGFAIESYRLADLMIAERAKTKGGAL